MEHSCASPRRAELLWQDPAQVDALLQLLRVPGAAAHEAWATDADVRRALLAAVSLMRALHHRADAVEVLSAQVVRAVQALCVSQPSAAAAVLMRLTDAEAECAGVASASGVVGLGSTVVLYAASLACEDAGVRAAAARGLAQLLQRAHTLVLLRHDESQRALRALSAVRQADVVATLCKVLVLSTGGVCACALSIDVHGYTMHVFRSVQALAGDGMQADATLQRAHIAAIGCLAATVTCAVEPATCSDAATYFPLARAMATDDAATGPTATGLKPLYEVRSWRRTGVANMLCMEHMRVCAVARIPCHGTLQARMALATELVSRPAALPALAAALQPERDIQAALSAMQVLLMTARVSPALCAMCAEAGLLAALLTARRTVNGALALAAAATIVDGCMRHAARGGGPRGPSAAGCDPHACQAIADMLLVRR